MRRLLLLLVVAGCQKADPEPAAKPIAAPAPTPAPAVAFAEPPPVAPTPPTPPTPTPPPPAALEVKVQLTAVTLADDCGGGVVTKRKSEPLDNGAKRDSADEKAYSRAARRCEQTSMQLVVSASAPAKVEIKSVELLDEHGASLGMLKPRQPTRWSKTASRYEAWDELLAANAMHNVSYVLQQPNWSKIGNRWNRTFTLKTVVSIGGIDKSATKKVTLEAPTTLPPNVKT